MEYHIGIWIIITLPVIMLLLLAMEGMINYRIALLTIALYYPMLYYLLHYFNRILGKSQK